MALFAFNRTGAPLLLATTTPPITLPQSLAPPSKGPGSDVTAQLRGLTSAQYAVLEAHRVAGLVIFEWSDEPDYATAPLQTTTPTLRETTASKVIHVDGTVGDDHNPGMASFPVKTMTKAFDLIEELILPGHTIVVRVHAGIYPRLLVPPKFIGGVLAIIGETRTLADNLPISMPSNAKITVTSLGAPDTFRGKILEIFDPTDPATVLQRHTIASHDGTSEVRPVAGFSPVPTITQQSRILEPAVTFEASTNESHLLWAISSGVYSDSSLPFPNLYLAGLRFTGPPSGGGTQLMRVTMPCNVTMRDCEFISRSHLSAIVVGGSVNVLIGRAAVADPETGDVLFDPARDFSGIFVDGGSPGAFIVAFGRSSFWRIVGRRCVFSGSGHVNTIAGCDIVDGTIWASGDASVSVFAVRGARMRILGPDPIGFSIGLNSNRGILSVIGQPTEKCVVEGHPRAAALASERAELRLTNVTGAAGNDVGIMLKDMSLAIVNDDTDVTGGTDIMLGPTSYTYAELDASITTPRSLTDPVELCRIRR